MVYGRTAISDGLAAVSRRALGRARTIYLTYAVLTTCAILAAKEGLAKLGPASSSEFVPSFSLWIKNLLLIGVPPLPEILRIYVVLFLLIPVIFWAVLRDRIHYVLIASAALWFAAAMGYGMTAIPNSGYFDMLSWQLLFVAGICLGIPRVDKNQPVTSDWWTYASAAAVLIFFVIRHERFVTGNELSGYFRWLSEWRHTLSAGRLLNFAAFSYLIFRFRRPLARLVNTHPGRLLTFLGQHSLPVFVWSISLTMMAASWDRRWSAVPAWGQAGLEILIVASCLVPAWFHSQWQTMRRCVGGDVNLRARLAVRGSLPEFSISSSID
jgi:hypothetical protein